MKVSSQVVDALKALHPGVRRDIRRALDDIEAGRKRDVRRLGAPLADFFRLRVGKYRVIFRFDPKTHEILAEYLDRRDTVYEKFTPPK